AGEAGRASPSIIVCLSASCAISEYPVVVDDDLVRVAFAPGDEQRAVEPFIGSCRRHELRQRAHVVLIGRHHFACCQARHHIRWTVAHALAGDADGHAVVGQHGAGDVELGNAVLLDQLPVGGAGNHTAAQTWSGEAALADGHGLVEAAGNIANLYRTQYLYVGIHEPFEFDRIRHRLVTWWWSVGRSEERRVGKEWRSWWAPYESEERKL